MTCPHCGAENLSEGFSCPSCGKALPREQTTMPGPRPVPPPEPARKPYALAGVLAAVIVILIVALIFALKPKAPVTGANSTGAPLPGTPVTQAPSPGPPIPGPAVTQAPTAKAPTLPPEDPNKKAIEAYLQKVSYIEKERQRVVNDLTEALLVMQLLQAGMNNPLLGSMSDLLEPDPEAALAAKEKSTKETPDQAQQVISTKVAQLKALDDQLKRTLPIPPPALPFARSYNSAFYAYAGAMIQIGQFMQQSQADPSKAASLAGQLSAMKGSLGARKDQALMAADQQLTALCQKYGIQKPFDVTDTPSGAVTGG